MNDRVKDVYEVARRHYVLDETMESIARDMGVSRSTVSRLLARAREQHIITFTLAEPPSSESRYAVGVSKRFGIRVHVVDVPMEYTRAQRFAAVTKSGAEILSTMVDNGTTLGISWGVTVAQIARYVQVKPLEGVRVVQMNGAVMPQDTAIPYVGSILQAFADAYHGKVVPFIVPAFFDYRETKEAMWRERSTRNVLDALSELDIAVFGVGCLAGQVPSHVYTSGYLSLEELGALHADGVVGDICTVLLRADGSYEDIEINSRATGPTPARLKNVKRRLCVVGDPSRVTALIAALRAGVVTDLVCDDQTVRRLWQLSCAE